MTMNRPPRILFAGGGTGGHLYPALALARAFQEREGGAEIFFLGARRGVEARVLPERGVPHELLPFEPIRRAKPWENWRLVPSLSSAFGGISRVFNTFRPDLVVGTGGYASGPVVAWGIFRGIPTAVQEQNSFPGVTTRWLAGRVRQIHLAFPEALQRLRPGPRTEVFHLGNPIQPPDPNIDRAKARDDRGIGEGPVVLVVGGSQGARAVNDALLADLTAFARNGGDPLTLPWFVWATGPSNFDHIRDGLTGLDLGDRVKVEPYINDMPTALATADVAISRAGAMALAELCAWGIPSILVPFPHAAANHQYHNARALADAGAAVLIPEAELTPGRLLQEVLSLTADDARRDTVARRALERGHPHAAREIVERLSTLLPAGGVR
jgi:UDP-N-acetylglucosamine--N-acetylmuramyl-(pentapeptide) pyrophosphoryl-undecaprenol N-acetylglucosamine transferase